MMDRDKLIEILDEVVDACRVSDFCIVCGDEDPNHQDGCPLLDYIEWRLNDLGDKEAVGFDAREFSDDNNYPLGRAIIEATRKR